VEYIKGQEPHHRKVTFQQEFLALLKKHRIECDNPYFVGRKQIWMCARGWLMAVQPVTW